MHERRCWRRALLVCAITGAALAANGCGDNEEPASEQEDSGQLTDDMQGATQDKRDASTGTSSTPDSGQSAGQGGVDASGGVDSGARDAGPASQDSGREVDTGAAAPDAGGGTPAARFSFFVTSQAGLAKLADNPNGFGGDLRFGKSDGLSGADEICRQLAESSMPGNGKTWRAFLSVTKGPAGTPVNAIDRVGDGPWYDRRGRLFTMNKAGLMSTRPVGADPLILNDLPNEEGVPNHDPGTGIIDNHNVLTGSTGMGTLDMRGLTATCQDWTSSRADGGKPRCGVTWPRASLTHWISVLDEGGCAPGATPPGAEAGMRGTVGALGGYGGFYCFALTP